MIISHCHDSHKIDYYRYCFSFSLFAAWKLPRAYICRTCNTSRIGRVSLKMFNYFISFFGWFFVPFVSLSWFYFTCRAPFTLFTFLIVQSTSINFIHIFKVHVAVVNVFVQPRNEFISLHDGTMGGIVNVSYLLRHHYWFLNGFTLHQLK